MTAAPKEALTEDYDQLATQWFIVSDLGLTAYSGHDGIDVFIHSLASADAAGAGRRAADRAQQRGAGRAAHRSEWLCAFRGRPCARRGRPGARRRSSPATSGDYAFLSLKSAAFDLSDRGVGGRPAPVGLDAFVYTERGVYRSGETVAGDRAAARRARAGSRGRAADAGDGAAGRRRISPRAGRRSGPRRPLAGACRSSPPPRPAPGACAPIPIPSGRRSARPPSWSRTMCPTASNSISPRKRRRSRRNAPAQVSVDGHFLYGAPASNLELTGAVTIAAAKERPGFAGYAFGLADDDVTRGAPGARRSAGDRRRRAKRASRSRSTRCRSPRARWKRAITVEHGGIRRPRGRAQADAADHADGADDRRQAGLLRPLARRRRQCRFRRGHGGARRQDAGAAGPALRTAQGRDLAINGTGRTANGNSSRSSAPSASPTAASIVAADKPARLSLPVKWGRYRLEVSTGEPNGPVTVAHFRRRLLCRGERRHARSARSRARQDRLQVRRHHDRGGDRAHAPAA